MRTKLLTGLVAFTLVMGTITGCSVPDINKDTKIVFTTGFKKNEVFRIEKASCTLPEIMVYLTNTKNQYESTFGPEIWETSYEDETIEDNVKETVLARLARVKTMNLLAIENNVSLDDSEKEKCEKAANEYYSKLNDTEIKELGIDEELIRNMYEEYTLANKVYKYLIADINPEISDDEARTITVEHIFFKTYSLNENGVRVPNSQQSQMESYQNAREAWERAKDGEDFSKLCAEYSDDPVSVYSFGKGMEEKSFEKAAFDLGTGEISGIVQTEYGYHIIKCISTFDREETDRNKVKIVEERRREVFNEKYSGFVKNLTKNMNKKLWDSVEFIQNDDVTVKNFFEVYKQYFDLKL